MRALTHAYAHCLHRWPALVGIAGAPGFFLSICPCRTSHNCVCVCVFRLVVRFRSDSDVGSLVDAQLLVSLHRPGPPNLGTVSTMFSTPLSCATCASLLDMLRNVTASEVSTSFFSLYAHLLHCPLQPKVFESETFPRACLCRRISVTSLRSTQLDTARHHLKK